MECQYSKWCSNDATEVVKVSVREGNVHCCPYHADEARKIRASNQRRTAEQIEAKRNHDPLPLDKYFIGKTGCWRLKADCPNWKDIAVSDEEATQIKRDIGAIK